MVKTFKKPRTPWGESLLKLSGTGSTKVAKIMVVQVCFPVHLYGIKTFKNLILQNRGCLTAESLHILLGTSACLQWLCHSGERTVARGPLVFYIYHPACLCFPSTTSSFVPFLPFFGRRHKLTHKS